MLSNKYKIRVYKETKSPLSTDWKGKKIENFIKNDNIDFNKFNYAFVCGKINDFFVFDFDSYKMNYLELNEHPLYKHFKNLDHKVFDTYTVKSANGGYHFYYKYDSDFKNKNTDIHIDIKTDNGLIIAPGSSIIKNNKKSYYKVVKDIPIKKMDDELKKWIFNNIYKNNENKTSYENSQIISNNNIYTYSLSDNDKKKILENLPIEYYENYDKWLLFTTASKSLECFDIWDDINKKSNKYDYNKNLTLWNGLNKFNSIKAVEHIFNIMEINKNILNYIKFAPIRTNINKFDEEINQEKLGYNFINSYLETGLDKILLNKITSNCLLIKSDTGTGKTTSFKHFISGSPAQKDHKFISIVSRISLANEQYRVFNEFGAECRLYNITNNFNNNNSYVVCLDSILKLIDIDFSNYVIYLDEVNSLIEYLISSSTLNSTRVLIYNLFFEIINNCKMVIGTDADINSICLDFFNYSNKKPYLIKNNYKHNKDVESEEINCFTNMIDTIKKYDKYIICCDSKANSEAIYKELDDDNIKLITSDIEDEDINLDNYNKVIFSPKIIYGLDSTIERPVFCYYKEHTINPCHMVQQICRCRNISKLYYYFDKKKFNDIKYSSLLELKTELLQLNKYGVKNFKLIGNNIIIEQYLNLLSQIEYNNECYKTNKFSHFLNIIENRGFKVNYNFLINQDCNKINDNKKEIKKEKLNNFNFADYKELNKILLLPEDIANDNKLLYVDKNYLNKHFNICDYYFKNIDKVKYSIDKLNDFLVNKVKNNKTKIYYLNYFKQEVNCEYNKIEVNNIPDNYQELETTYKLLFRDRTKDLNFNNKKCLEKVLNNIHKNLFINELFNVSQNRSRSKDRGNRTYNINENELDKHRNIYNYRKINNNISEGANNDYLI